MPYSAKYMVDASGSVWWFTVSGFQGPLNLLQPNRRLLKMGDLELVPKKGASHFRSLDALLQILSMWF